MAYARKKTATRRKSSVRKSSVGKAGSKPGATRRRTKKAPPERPPGHRDVESVPGGIRLNKLLADHGLASRRGADEMIEGGHLFVDGVQVFELGLKVDPETQRIEIDGEPLIPTGRQKKRYYLLSKPPGVVCTNERRELRPRAIDLIKDRAKGRIYTVGRLDEESKGLIILTNDGEFANRVMHPRYGVTKTYAVKLEGRISDSDVQKVRDGVYLYEGRAVGARVLIKKRTRETTLLEVTLQEGKNREIRRMFLSVGHKVLDLKRIRIGNLTDKKLKVGFWRYLTPFEVRELVALSEGEEMSEEPPLRASTGASTSPKTSANRKRAVKKRANRTATSQAKSAKKATKKATTKATKTTSNKKAATRGRRSR